MSELTYFVLKFGFLALMWVFVFIIVYALRSDLFGPRVQKLIAKEREAQLAASTAPAPPAAAPTQPSPVAFDAPKPAPRATGAASSDPAARDSRTATRLVITDGPKAGLEVDLPHEQLTIGRSGDSGLIIRDDYTSSHHARLLKWPDGWVIQDLDSTNGTFLDGVRVHGPTYVPLRTPITIGTTTFELRN